VTVLIEAEAGIGKTSLLEATCARARDGGMAVLRARGSQLEGRYAMGVARQCFEAELRRRGERAVPGGAAEVAAAVIIDLPDSDAAPDAVLRGLYGLTAALAEERPTVLAIDDAHWADEPSLRFVAYLARRVQSLPVALVVGTRAAEDPAIATVLDELRRELGTDVLEPRALDADGVEAFLRAEQSGSVEPEFTAACHDATGGNPFLLEELVRALRAHRLTFTAANAGRVTERTPPTVARSVRMTLDRLGAPCEALARAVAVLGDDIEVDLAGALAGLPTIEAAFAAGELTRAGLLADATPLRFRHPLLAGGARATLTAPELAVAHARAADVLRDRGAGPERVALQLMHATPAGDPQVVADLRAAARRTAARGAPATAAALLSRALEEPPPDTRRVELLFELGRVEAAVGRTGDAAVHFRDAYDRGQDPVLRGKIVLALLDAIGGDMGDVFALAPLVSQTRADVAPHDRELALRLSCAEAISGPPHGVLERQAAVLELPGDTPGEALALGILVVPLVFAGRTADELDDVVSRVFRQAERIVAEAPISLLTTSLHLGLLFLDRLDDDLWLLDAAVATAQRRGSTADIAIAYAARAQLHRRAGRLGEAEADARTALAAGGESGWAGGGEGAIIPLVGALVEQGRLDEADRLLAEAYPDGRAIPDHPHMNWLILERMDLRIAQGRRDEALADWTESVRRAEPLFGIDSVAWVRAMCAAGGLYAARGEREAAEALIERALGHARTWGRPAHLGQALAALALLQTRDQAVETLREAVGLLRASPVRLELARALVSLGSVMRRLGDRAASREPLREGHEVAVECGAEGLADTARAELRASGVRIRRATLDGVDGLTASERRIAELAAMGASNADIAQTLFLTVKTIEMHLTRTYRKLDIGGRAELPRALGAGTGSPP
jgi:DNA-binding CsgD family transcriptional regulator